MNLYYCETCGVRITDGESFTHLQPNDERLRRCPKHRAKGSGIGIPVAPSTPPPQSAATGHPVQSSAARIRPQRPSGSHHASAPGRPVNAGAPGGGAQSQSQITMIAGAVAAATLLGFLFMMGSSKTPAAAPVSNVESPRVSAPRPSPAPAPREVPPERHVTAIATRTPAPVPVPPAPAIVSAPETAAIPPKPQEHSAETAATSDPSPPRAETSPAKPMGFMSDDMSDIRESTAAHRLEELNAAAKDGTATPGELRARYKSFIDSYRSTKAGKAAVEQFKALPPPRADIVEGPSDGLAARWNFSETGSFVLDGSGHEIDAKLVGPTRGLDGAGHTLSFNGANDAVTFSPEPFRAISGSFAIACWAKPSAERNATPESTDGAVGINTQPYAIFPTQGGTAYGAGHAGVGFSIGTNGVSVWEHSHSYLPSVLVYGAALANWTHVVVVYNKNKPALFINGIRVKDGLTGPMTPHPSASVGGGQYGFYSGLLGDVRIYNRALTDDEVKALYDAGRH